MTSYRDPIDLLPEETEDLQYDDAPEAQKEPKVVETLEEELLRLREEYRQQVDRMIRLAAEAPIVLRPGLSESEAYDFFISYVTEDKEDLVDELVQELRKKGAKVRCDDCVLRAGDSLRRRMDEGLEDSLFGALVLSPDFFVKEWPREELDDLISPETRDSDKRIFPLWRIVPKDEVIRNSPRMPDWSAFTIAEHFIEDIAEKMLQAKELRLAKRTCKASA